MMKSKQLIYISVFVTAIFFAGCKSDVSGKQEPLTSDTISAPAAKQPTEQELIDAETTEANYGDEDAGGFKTTVNERYGFSFKIPSNWKALDKSNNGDGYFIETGEKGVDLRIYGEQIEGNEVMAEMELKSCEKTEDFKFSNGYPGTVCYQSGDTYYYLDTPKTRIIFYVHADSKWKQRNGETINTIAKSMNAGAAAF